jgi:hypothetical protein
MRSSAVDAHGLILAAAMSTRGAAFFLPYQGLQCSNSAVMVKTMERDTGTVGMKNAVNSPA